MEHLELTRGDYSISTDTDKLNISFIHHFLSVESSWSKGIPLDKVEKSIKNSLNFGLFHREQQIGYARVISDYSTIAYLGDVFIDTQFRRLGLSNWLMEVVVNHHDLQQLRRWILLTSTAPWLYEKYGFTPLANSKVYMEKVDLNVYQPIVE